MPNKKKLTAGLIGGAAALTIGAVGLGTTGTLAQWVDQAKLGDTTIDAGNLDVEPIGGITWTNQAGTTIVPSTYKITPGETLTGLQDVDAVLEGDTITAKVTVLSTASGELVSTDPNSGVTLNYEILDKSGTSLGKGVVGQITPFTLSKDIVGTTADGKKDLTVKLTANFLKDTTNRDKTQQQLNISGFAVKVEQV